MVKTSGEFPKQKFGTIRYPSGSVVIGRLTPDMYEEAKKGKLVILEEH